MYYLLIIGLASLCAVVFSSKPVAAVYDFVVEGTWKIFLWALGMIEKFLALVHIPVNAVKEWALRTIGGIEANPQAQEEIKEK